MGRVIQTFRILEGLDMANHISTISTVGSMATSEKEVIDLCMKIRPVMQQCCPSFNYISARAQVDI
jgi:hypothetical protein